MKVGRRSVRKAKALARKIRVEGLGEAIKGMSDAYKKFHEVAKDNDEVFKFRGKPDVIGLQETKCDVVDVEWFESIWGGNGCGYAQLSANRNSGGILLLWDKRVFTCKEAIGDERFIAVRGSWKGKVKDVFLVCIYRP
nr:RNA-directed DNA polymerase, eukaryota [Tanacetum cinerariifolium]